MPAASGTSNGFESGVSRRQMASSGAAGGTHHSAQELGHDAGGLAVDERAVAAGALEDERLVVEAEEVQERGVVVVVGDDVLDRLVAELVGRAVDVARA